MLPKPNCISLIGGTITPVMNYGITNQPFGLASPVSVQRAPALLQDAFKGLIWRMYCKLVQKVYSHMQ